MKKFTLIIVLNICSFQFLNTQHLLQSEAVNAFNLIDKTSGKTEGRYLPQLLAQFSAQMVIIKRYQLFISSCIQHKLIFSARSLLQVWTFVGIYCTLITSLEEQLICNYIKCLFINRNRIKWDLNETNKLFGSDVKYNSSGGEQHYIIHSANGVTNLNVKVINIPTPGYDISGRFDG